VKQDELVQQILVGLAVAWLVHVLWSDPPVKVEQTTTTKKVLPR